MVPGLRKMESLSLGWARGLGGVPASWSIQHEVFLPTVGTQKLDCVYLESQAQLPIGAF